MGGFLNKLSFMESKGRELTSSSPPGEEKIVLDFLMVKASRTETDTRLEMHLNP